MVSEEILLDLLDQKGCLRILFLLNKKGEGKFSDLQSIRGIGQGSTYNAISNLKDLDLIFENRDRFNARVFRLTDKGREVALKIQEIVEILKK